jgi:transcriptional regulator with XRE-family HTH domain
VSIYESIAFLAQEKGYSIAELEDKAGLGNGTVGKWRSKSPSLSSLKKIATTLETTVSDILKEW